MTAPLGLIAGVGALPQHVVHTARAVGRDVVCVELAIPHRARVEGVVAHKRVGLARIGAMFGFLRRHGVREFIMIGGVPKAALFRPMLPDLTALRILGALRSFQDDHALRTVANAAARFGLTLVDSRPLLQDWIVPEGVLGKVVPSAAVETDIAFGFDMLDTIGRIDLGQTVVVRGRMVIAVEGIEGTDACIARGGSLSRGRGLAARHGVVVCKAAKAGQDVRLDLPTIGPDTMRALQDAGASALAVRAGTTLIVEPAQTLALADAHGIAVVGVPQENGGG